MRKPAATPIIRGKTERPLEEHFSLPHTDARAARRAFERLVADADSVAPLSPDVLDRLEAYVGLLLEANARLNLTRVVEPDEVARLHLLDAISALPIVDRLAPQRAIDLGSGGGVPGLVLALARPSVQWTLVDSVRKKADALRSFADALSASSVRVVAERAEVLGRDAAFRESFDMVTARACAALPVLAEYGRQPRTARAFFVKYQDRILFGKDTYVASEYPIFFRTFETADEYFDGYRDYHAFWKLYGLDLPDGVLQKLYYANALKVVHGLPAASFPPLTPATN